MVYTKEKLEQYVAESISISEVVRKFGKKVSGGTHSHVKRQIAKYEIDTSHFLGKAAHCGQNSNCNKRHWTELLVLREHGNRLAAERLRRALVESGREYKCEDCGIEDIWNNKKIVLEVDHKNNDWLDNRPKNVRFLCPNCHSQKHQGAT